jgi:hypothetical protein
MYLHHCPWQSRRARPAAPNGIRSHRQRGPVPEPRHKTANPQHCSAAAPFIVIDDVGDALVALADLQQLVDLLLVFHDRERHPGMLENVAHLLGNRVLVDRHRNGTQRLRCAHREIQPRPVVANDGQPVTALQAKLVKPDGQRTHFIEHIRPCPGLPDAEILLTHRGTGCKRLRVAQKQFRKGIVSRSLRSYTSHMISTLTGRSQSPPD